jgi:hypothetical protein
LSACKCHKHYENIESFKKNKSLKEKIEISKISNEPIYLNYHKDINIDINSIKSKYDKAKKELFQKSNELKNKIIKLYEEKINHVEKMLDKYIKRNNIIIEVIDKIIKSYEMMKDNPSNVQNLLNNCVFDNRFKINSLLEVFKTSLDDISKKLENYFEEELIVSNSIVNRSIKKEKLTNNNYCEISNFIEINKNICAWCSKYKSYITVMNPNKMDSYNLNFIADLKYVNCMIKSSPNNLISIGNDGFIKIWPLIDDEFIDKEIKKEDNDKIKIIDVNLKPLLEFKDETKEIKITNDLIKEDNMFGRRKPDEAVMCGGTTRRYDAGAPKTITSNNMILFDVHSRVRDYIDPADIPKGKKLITSIEAFAVK